MKKFKELSINLQKKRIIQDAILQIKTGVVIPAHAGYVNFGSREFDTKSFQKILECQKNVCEVCAKGSIFTSYVLNLNKVTIDDVNRYGESFQKKKLLTWFTHKELDMIEAAYEKTIVCDESDSLKNETYEVTELGKKCIRFGKRFKKPKNRLLGILKNILANKTFKP